MTALLLRGVGLDAVTIPLMSLAYTGMERADVPHASIITRIASQVGGSFGAVILATSATSDLAAGFDAAFWWATGFALLGVPLSLLVPSPALEVTAVDPVTAVAK